MNKQTMGVGAYELTAWTDEHGMLRLEVENAKGKAIIGGLNHPWENDNGKGEHRVMVTDNEHIIDELMRDAHRSADGRLSPAFLRSASEDPAYVAWYRETHGQSTPLEAAARVEELRRKEGRRLTDGALVG